MSFKTCKQLLLRDTNEKDDQFVQFINREIDTHMHPHRHAHTHTRTHTQREIDTHTHTHTHTDRYTHAHTLVEYTSHLSLK